MARDLSFETLAEACGIMGWKNLTASGRGR